MVNKLWRADGKNIMRNGSLWRNVVFKKKKKNISTNLISRPQNYTFWGPEIKHLNANNFVEKLFLPGIINVQLRRPVELKYSQVCYFMHSWYTPSEKTGLWQLLIVSSVFKFRVKQNCFVKELLPARTSVCRMDKNQQQTTNN